MRVCEELRLFLWFAAIAAAIAEAEVICDTEGAGDDAGTAGVVRGVTEK
jgi:hypothetical protein